MKFKKILSRLLVCSAIPSLSGCTTVNFPTVKSVDLPRFMGAWYVAAGRFTPFEKDVHNAVEIYSYDEKNQTIDIDFSYRQGSPQGKVKKLPQTAKVVPGTQNAHWLVSPFWPLKFDYLVVALAPDYSWVAIGVPSQKYLWIMFRKKNPTKDEIQVAINELVKIHYNTDDLTYVPQQW